VVSATSDINKPTSTQTKILGHFGELAELKSFANEKAFKTSYSGYEGSITTFLQPYAEPGFSALINDERYPERNGEYLIESVHTKYGINGARRTVEIGPRRGFYKKV
jgi:hypothetical protein